MAHILDISRLVSRAHFSFDTGVDRVERAFVLDSLERFNPSFFLARIGMQYAVLDAPAMQEFLKLEQQGDWQASTGFDRFRFKLSRKQRSVRSVVRRLSLFTVSLKNLTQSLGSVGFDDFDYTNVGHTNLGASFLEELRSSGAQKMSAFVHDLIPLDHPEYCRADRIAPFTRNVKNVAAHFDQIYCNSNYTAGRIRYWFAQFGPIPKVRVSRLGSEKLSASDYKSDSDIPTPSFAVLGTIEPRKNISFLLDVWECLSDRDDFGLMPHLLIIGKRGWEDDAVLARIDRAVETGFVSEMSDLSDDQVRSTLLSCKALLFPSLVEGYGLPAQEALGLGVPVIASDIDVFEELFSETARLLATDDPIVWCDEIIKRTKFEELENNSNLLFKNISWDDFFSVLYVKN